MSKITENAIEKFCIELLEKQGYQTIHDPDIAPDGERPERSNYEDVCHKRAKFKNTYV